MPRTAANLDACKDAAYSRKASTYKCKDSTNVRENLNISRAFFENRLKKRGIVLF